MNLKKILLNGLIGVSLFWGGFLVGSLIRNFLEESLMGKSEKKGSLGVSQTNTIETVSSTVFTQQDDYFKANGKYQHIPKAILNGVTYRVDEYLYPDGTRGYQVYFEKSDGSKRSYGTGKEAKNWSYDWTPSIVTTTL